MKWIEKGGIDQRHIYVDDFGEIWAEITRDSYRYDWHYGQRIFLDAEAAKRAASCDVTNKQRKVESK